MKTFLRRTLKTLGALLVLLLLFHIVENWRGRHAEKAWLQAHRAAGDSLDFSDYVPLAVPDAENFAAVPLIDNAVKGKGWGVDFGVLEPALNSKSVGSWAAGKVCDLKAIEASLNTQDLAKVLAPYDSVLDQLTQAAKRPGSRFLIDYTPSVDSIPPLLGFRNAGRTLRLRALLRLHNGDSEGAMQDVLASLRVARHLEREPHLITQLLSNAWIRLSLQPVWEGLAAHRWNANQLAELQQQLADLDVLAPWLHSLRCERVSHAEYTRKFRETGWWSRFEKGQHWTQEEPIGKTQFLIRSLLLPEGWFYQSRVRGSQCFEGILAVVDPAAHRVRPDVQKQTEQAFLQGHRSPYTFLIQATPPALGAQNLRIANNQASVDEALIACALERFRLARKQYPDSLIELSPTYLSKLPPDVTTGQPMHYARTEEGGYRLWSLGWNGTDEGGQVASDSQKLEEGDWSWVVNR